MISAVKAKVAHPRSEAFGAYEWATSTVNFLHGCRHGCKYCYARAMAARFRTKEAAYWNSEQVRDSVLLKGYSRRDGTVMFPSAHDLQIEHMDIITVILTRLLQAGNRVLVVSKPHVAVIKQLCALFSAYRNKILFRFSIGSVDSHELSFWEPGAPSYEERLSCLKYAHSKGFSTSVSCEPMLDAHPDKVIQEVLPFVTDAVWLGKANFLLSRLRANRVDDPLTVDRAEDLMIAHSAEFISNLYRQYKNNPAIRWKDSIKKVLGFLPSKRGEDR